MQVAVFQGTPNHRCAHQQHQQCGFSACQNETELSWDGDRSGPACGQISKFLEALNTDIILLTANLSDGADSMSPVVMAKLIDNRYTGRLPTPGPLGPTASSPAKASAKKKKRTRP